MYRKYIKRPLDVICAVLALIVFCWLFVIIAVLVRIKLGKPVIFKQKRPGKDENIFTMYKFRTMPEKRDENGELLPDSERLGHFGRTLRKLSLDELPEVVNILTGDMSIVGPRPLLVEYLPLYNYHQKRRHEVRPGLTGLAQVNGRNAISWEEKFDMDVEYIDSIGFFQDFKILIATVKVALIRREGITKEGSATMTKFEGTHKGESPYV
jgi:lipopolysaccharide/colanic/teichoic acid biosynthesis glycosyltransferase